MFQPRMWPRLQEGALNRIVMRLLEDGHMGGRNMLEVYDIQCVYK